MSSIIISGDTSGTATIQAPAVAGTPTLTLPTVSGTLLTTGSTTGISGSAISTGTVAEAYGGTGTSTGYYGFKNRIINGAMVIDQRNAGASVTPANGQYNLDRWQTYVSQASKLTVQQNAGSVTLPAGFVKYLGITSSSAYSVNSTDYFFLQQPIEGLNVADFGWGTANAVSATLSFRVYSSLTGTFSGSLRNNSGTVYSYPFSYTISSANTWTTVSVQIPAITSGTWLTTNGVGIALCFCLGSGSTRLSSSANSWQVGDFDGVTGTTSVVGTSGATFYITGVQLEKGSTATSFDYRPYGTELQLCMRYFEELANTGVAGAYINGGYAYSGSQIRTTLRFTVEKRATPTMSNNGTQLQINGTNQTVVFDGANKRSSLVYKDGYSGLSVGVGAQFLEVNSGVTQLWANAEL